MRLIDRYVHDVVRRLPENQRSDVAKELATEIEEMVEDRSGGKGANGKTVSAVLTELGHPRVLADRYRERPRYVIGPEHFETYIYLLKTIYVVVLPLLVFLVWTTEAMTVEHTVVSLMMKLTGVAFEAAVHIFFWTTLSFIIVKHIAGGKEYDSDWKPEDLPELPPEQEIGRSESYFGIAWSVLAVLATLFQVPTIYDLVGPENIPQFFAPEMWPGWTLGLLAVALLGLAIELLKFLVGGWTRLTVWLVTATNLITVIFFMSLIGFVQPIANPAMMELLDKNIADSVETGVRIFVGIVVLVCLWEIGEAIYKYRKGVKR